MSNHSLCARTDSIELLEENDSGRKSHSVPPLL
jgi:hypothetical protein